MRISLIQLDVDPAESLPDRRRRVADLVRGLPDSDLVVLPELWTVGAFSFDDFAASAEPLDGPTLRMLAAAAADAGSRVHAGSIVERDDRGRLHNTSLLLGPDGQLQRTYRKIHRFGFDSGEAVLMEAGSEIVTAPAGPTTLGLATCYDLRFPEQFRLLVDAGAELLVLCAGWPAARLGHWSVLARARAVESQAYVLACGTAGTHAGVEMAGHSLVVDPRGEVVAEAGAAEQVLTVDIDPALVRTVRADFPALRDRVLALPLPAPLPTA
ncbi:carbon-nitrogen family hydrolase [Kitasatospora sp. NPDC048540]|uniref:carbon-nitrogen family hydrolase n=1 Tax=unclassified Kitasatospora TaxID=2633591 RepID=UPI00053993EB|nr:carbon-nitrogen family hydrolase [Kitasatospora sp. MBT63]